MRKHLKVVFILLIVVGIIAVSTNIISASGDIKVLLEGKELAFDVPPQIIEGRTLLPLRAIFEALGLEVGWDDATRVITGTAEGKEIILKLDSKDAKVNGINRTLDVPAKSINGRTLVPVRFIAESLNMDVNWDQGNRIVIINKNDAKDEIITFKDPNFEKAVRDNIKKPEGIIYKSDVEKVTSLIMGFYPINSPTTKVNSLEGIQNFANLEKLSIDVNNTINDLTPVKNLINLKEIYVSGSNISDISRLTNLVNLESLRISDANIYNLTPINNLVNLKELTLTNNNIIDISPLKNLVNLETIMVSDNNIYDITILKNQRNLETVVIHNTEVSDVSVLLELPNLEFVGAFGIPISIEDMAKVYQPLSDEGVQILTDYEEKELLNLKIVDKQIVEKTDDKYGNKTDDRYSNNTDTVHYKEIKGVIGTEQLLSYLEKNYSRIETPAGEMILSYTIRENNSSLFPMDYRIYTEWDPLDGVSPYDLKYSTKISEEDRNETIEILAQLQKDIANVSFQALPDKKIEGAFYSSGYEYYYLEVGYYSIQFLTWINYDPPFGYYSETEITGFTWYTEFDDYQFLD